MVFFCKISMRIKCMFVFCAVLHLIIHNMLHLPLDKFLFLFFHLNNRCFYGAGEQKLLMQCSCLLDIF